MNERFVLSSSTIATAICCLLLLFPLSITNGDTGGAGAQERPGNRAAHRTSIYLCRSGAGLTASSSSDDFMVKFRRGRARQALLEIEEQFQGGTIEAKAIARGGWHLVSIKGISAGPDTLTSLRTHPDVLYAEPDYGVRASGTGRLPDDERLDEQWSIQAIHAPEAWARISTSDLVVAVIDTGVDYTHPDLAENIWTNAGETAGNGIDDDGNGYVDDTIGWNCHDDTPDPMDGHGHGTHCAGIIGAVGNNGTGVAGVCWHVNIMPLKALGNNGKGSISNIVEAIDYAIRMDADVLSNSWTLPPGGGSYSRALEQAIEAADAAGVLFIVAAGQDSANIDQTPSFPSAFNSPNIIAVAATDSHDALIPTSNYGASTVDLTAPGAGVLNTDLHAGYQPRGGSSAAAPHVAGACALVWTAAGADVPHDRIKHAILHGTDIIPGLEGECVTSGRLNVADSLNVLMPALHPTADLNGDECINVADLIVVRDNLGKTSSDIAPECADVNIDGVVNIADLLLVRQQLGVGDGCGDN